MSAIRRRISRRSLKALTFAAGTVTAVAVLAWACSRGPAAPAGSLTILLPDDIMSLDPNQEVEQVTDSVLFNVFEPLVGFDENLELRTILAESWEHPEPERWRIHLRRNVRFQDGTPLTASLVRETLLSIQRAQALEATLFMGQIKEIVAPSERTLDIVTREPRAILANLPFIYVAKKNGKGDFPPFVGTGPYRIREWARGERVVLERSPDYWGPAPEFRQVTFVPVPDPKARVARLRGGSADIIYRVPPELAGDGKDGVRFVERQGLTVSYLAFNLRSKAGNPFRDVRVRKAVNLALDRRALVARELHGRGSVSTQPVAPLVFGYDPDLPAPAHDIGAAQRLMAEAGHAGGFKVRLDFARNRLASPEVLQEALRQIKVEVELNGLERNAFFDLMRSGQTELFFAGWDCSSGEASEFYEFNLHTPAGGYGVGNYGAYSNPEIDRIAETNAAILDPRDRKRLLQRAAAIVMDEVPILPLYVADIIFGARDGVVFPPRADSEIRLSDVRSAQPGGGR